MSTIITLVLIALTLFVLWKALNWVLNEGDETKSSDPLPDFDPNARTAGPIYPRKPIDGYAFRNTTNAQSTKKTTASKSRKNKNDSDSDSGSSFFDTERDDNFFVNTGHNDYGNSDNSGFSGFSGGSGGGSGASGGYDSDSSSSSSDSGGGDGGGD